MAFTTPATVTAGTAATASYANTYIRDNISWMATDSPACRAYNSANQSLTTGVALALALNSERFDNAAMHSTSVNTSRLVVPTGGAGKYLTGGSVAITLSGAGSYRYAYILQNSTTILTGMVTPPNATANPQISLCTVYALAAADYVELVAQQDSGGALNALNVANYSPEYWAFWYRT